MASLPNNAAGTLSVKGNKPRKPPSWSSSYGASTSPPTLGSTFAGSSGGWDEDPARGKISIATRVCVVLIASGIIGSVLPALTARVGRAAEGDGLGMRPQQRRWGGGAGVTHGGGRGALGGDGTKNLVGGTLKPCSGPSQETPTGWTRDGSCAWDPTDSGYHEVRRGRRSRVTRRRRDAVFSSSLMIINRSFAFFFVPWSERLTTLFWLTRNRLPTHRQVCVKMDDKFLASSAANDGNDLSSVVAHGEHWCICAWAWASAVERDPKVRKTSPQPPSFCPTQILISLHLEIHVSNGRVRVFHVSIDSTSRATRG